MINSKTIVVLFISGLALVTFHDCSNDACPYKEPENYGTGMTEPAWAAIFYPASFSPVDSIWTIPAVILIITGCAAATLLIYFSQLKARNQYARLEQKLLLSQMNPHFIFNCLSAIQSLIYTKNPGQACDYLTDFSRLMRLVLENSRCEEVPLSNEILALRAYLKLQKLRLAGKLDYKIVYDPSINIGRVMISPMLIQPFLENSIEHGILHKEGKGHISLEIKVKDDHVVAVVTDDGIGFTRAGEINSCRDMGHQSMATSIISERLLNLYSRGEKNAKLVITDRYKGEGIAGTKVELTIPCRMTVP